MSFFSSAPVRLERFRLLIALTGLACGLIIPLRIATVPALDWHAFIGIDYLVWASSSFASAALILDYLKFYKGYGCASTLTVAGLVMVIAGRLASLCYSLAQWSLWAPLIGGGIANAYAIALSTPVIAGSVLGFAVVALHSARKAPVILMPGSPYAAYPRNAPV